MKPRAEHPRTGGHINGVGKKGANRPSRLIQILVVKIVSYYILQFLIYNFYDLNYKVSIKNFYQFFIGKVVEGTREDDMAAGRVMRRRTRRALLPTEPGTSTANEDSNDVDMHSGTSYANEDFNDASSIGQQPIADEEIEQQQPIAEEEEEIEQQQQQQQPIAEEEEEIEFNEIQQEEQQDLVNAVAAATIGEGPPIDPDQDEIARLKKERRNAQKREYKKKKKALMSEEDIKQFKEKEKIRVMNHRKNK
jgi:hypothetical protein